MSNLKYAAVPRVLLGCQEKQLSINKNFFFWGRSSRLNTSSCTVVFLIFPIQARLQSEIIKILMLSNLTCDTDIGAGQPVIQAMPRIQQFLIKLHLEGRMQ
jgi:hypothetical protein